MAQLKSFVFFDFEMLCSNRGMPYEEMEAIRLGAVKYDIQTEKISYFDRYIKPKSKKPLSAFCKKLTRIADEDLTDANHFTDVFKDFLTWVGGVKRSQFFSWSKNDLIRLKIDAKQSNIASSTITKIEKRYIDFQQVLTRRVTKNNLSVENALKLYGLEFIGEPHNPMYDAYNTLRIYLSFFNEPLQSDIIMVNQFISECTWDNHLKINALLTENLRQDIDALVAQLSDIDHIRNAEKMLRMVKRLVKKYENIIINRSGLFTDDLVNYVKLLKEFYMEILISYKHHKAYASKTMILDEYLTTPIKIIAS